MPDLHIKPPATNWSIFISFLITFTGLKNDSHVLLFLCSTQILSGQNVTSQDVERAADTIEKATDSKQFLKSDTDVVELIAESLESVVEAGEPSLKVIFFSMQCPYRLVHTSFRNG